MGQTALTFVPFVALAKHISPQRAEDLVAQVFADHLSCEVHYMTDGVYAPDGGIDFVLVNADAGLRYAFQVKRRQNSQPEKVRPVREFIGAVALTPFPKAYYVTTAKRFTRATHRELHAGAATLQQKGISVELVNGVKLQQLLLERKTLPATVPRLQKLFKETKGWSEILSVELESSSFNLLAASKRESNLGFDDVLAATFGT